LKNGKKINRGNIQVVMDIKNKGENM